MINICLQVDDWQGPFSMSPCSVLLKLQNESTQMFSYRALLVTLKILTQLTPCNVASFGSQGIPPCCLSLKVNHHPQTSPPLNHIPNNMWPYPLQLHLTPWFLVSQLDSFSNVFRLLFHFQWLYSPLLGLCLFLGLMLIHSLYGSLNGVSAHRNALVHTPKNMNAE